ncbi:MAG: L,D-transpeptidase family protein, partial [Coprococcus sp.]
ASGRMVTGFATIPVKSGGKKKVYYDNNGAMVYGEYKCNDNKWHYFNTASGRMVTGFATIPVKSGGKKKVYYDNNGAMVYGEYKCNDNKWHYFNTASGKMVTGFATIPIKSGGKKKVYYDNNGAMVYGWVSTGGTNYYCDLKSGALKYTFKKQNGYYLAYNNRGELVKDLRSDFGNQSSYVIKVNTSTNTITVYAKFKDGTYTMPLVAFICSCGAPSTPTPLGTYYTSDRWRWLRMMGPSWGQWVTQIKGDYLFHSVYYNSKNNNNNLSVKAYNKLGTACSHGCVRLKAGDAKWIYDNCKLQTKIVIYKGASSTDPLGKPTAYKLSFSHTWDPTDPNMAYKCKQHGCH